MEPPKNPTRPSVGHRIVGESALWKRLRSDHAEPSVAKGLWDARQKLMGNVLRRPCTDLRE